MSTVTGLTAARMQAIIDDTIVSAAVNGSGHLILTKHSGATVDAGAVTGPTGAAGPGFTPGFLAPFAGPTSAIPAGWLNCDGSSLLRASFLPLFGVIGTIWGSVDGTHFTLPSFSNRVIRGNTVAPGAQGGSDTHAHTLSDAGGAGFLLGTSSAVLRARHVAARSFTQTHQMTVPNVASSSSGAISGAIGLNGSSDSGSSLQPYADALVLIKT